MASIMVPGTATADKVLTGFNFCAGPLWNVAGTLPAGVPAASGSSATVVNGQITITGLAFTPVVVLTQYYYSGTQTAYLRTIGWGWNGSDQKHLIGVSGPSPGSSYFLDTAGGDITLVSGGFTGWVAPTALNGGTCSWVAYGS